MKSFPDISVYIMTYYHEKYIRQALDSVLMQETKYSYEIVIADDCSKDATIEIVKEYIDKYPHIIRLSINTDNLGIPKNIFKARCLCRGKYIVNLSGDDYWVDSHKLDKQADFLEKNSEYFAVCCSLEMRYDDDLTAVKSLPDKKMRSREFTMLDYEQGRIMYTHGFMMRNAFLTEAGRYYFSIAQTISDKIDDAVDCVLILKYGRVYVLPDILNVYRVSRKKNDKHNYNARYKSIEKVRNYIEMNNGIYRYYDGKINLLHRYKRMISVALLNMIRSCDKKEYKVIFKTIPSEYRRLNINNVFIRSIPHALRIAFEQMILKYKAKKAEDNK